MSQNTVKIAKIARNAKSVWERFIFSGLFRIASSLDFLSGDDKLIMNQ